MPDWIFWVAGFIALGALGAYGAAQRAKQAQGLASKLGFRYIGAGGYDVVGLFVLLGHPRTRSPPPITNLARGEREGVELTLFDYSTEYNDFTSVVLRAAGLDLPHVLVGPPSIVSLNGRIVVRPRLSAPLEFAERPGFKALYWASAERPTDREVFTPALLDQLEREPGVYLETLGDRVLVSKTRLKPDRRSRLLTDDEVPAFLDEAMALFKLVAVRRGWTPATRPVDSPPSEA